MTVDYLGVLGDQSVAVRSARQRFDLAKAAYEAARAEMREAEEAVTREEEKFIAAAWKRHGLETPFGRYLGKPGDRPPTRGM
jgi:hypothetical protein